ncbi:GntR family transcriptional regulator [Clostridia bacterium]|nr:GntR family transcriptional regulator [Clostridia bacterium]
MLIDIRPDSDVPIYLQIREQIVAGIASGQIRPGDPLPSVRQMARDLGVNMHTVNKAYIYLQTDGYVRVLGRRGVVAADAPAPGAETIRETEIEFRRILTEAKARGLTREAVTELFEKQLRAVDDAVRENADKGGF